MLCMLIVLLKANAKVIEHTFPVINYFDHDTDLHRLTKLQYMYMYVQITFKTMHLYFVCRKISIKPQSTGV